MAEFRFPWRAEPPESNQRDYGSSAAAVGRPGEERTMSAEDAKPRLFESTYGARSEAMASRSRGPAFDCGAFDPESALVRC